MHIHHSQIRRIVLVLLFSLTTTVHADFQITEGFSQLTDTKLRTQAAFDLSLGDDPIQALNNGIPLTVAVEMVLFRERRWLPDAKIAQWQFSYEISYHALSGRYVVRQKNSEKYDSYGTINAALKAVGQFSSVWDTAGSVSGDDEYDYRVTLRVRLDLTPLPAPIKLVSHIARQWRQNSGWEKWSVLR